MRLLEEIPTSLFKETVKSTLHLLPILSEGEVVLASETNFIYSFSYLPELPRAEVFALNLDISRPRIAYVKVDPEKPRKEGGWESIFEISVCTLETGEHIGNISLAVRLLFALEEIGIDISLFKPLLSSRYPAHEISFFLSEDST